MDGRLGGRLGLTDLNERFEGATSLSDLLLGELLLGDVVSDLLVSDLLLGDGVSDLLLSDLVSDLDNLYGR